MKLNPDERILTGQWVVSGGEVIADETCHRITYLLNEHLRKVVAAQSGWDVLYVDPGDGRFWELTFPQSELHGGGPPQLRNLTIDEVRQKYGLDPDNL